MRVIEAQCSWSWRLTITPHINHDSNLGAQLRMVADGEVSGHTKLLTESHTEHDRGVLTTHWRANGRRGGGTGR